MQGYCSNCGSIIYDVMDESHVPGPAEALVCRICGTANTTKPKAVVVEEPRTIEKPLAMRPKSRRK